MKKYPIEDCRLIFKTSYAVLNPAKIVINNNIRKYFKELFR
jgi:hypothetical protein